MWKKLYRTYVRPHLEYAIPVWNPYSTGDIMILEKIQHRATKIAHSMKGLSYNKRLEILNLTTLKTRRTRGDLIQKFKDISKIDEINWEIKPVALPPRRGHRSYFERELIKNCDQRFNYFNNRIAQAWNAILDEILTLYKQFQKQNGRISLEISVQSWLSLPSTVGELRERSLLLRLTYIYIYSN